MTDTTPIKLSKRQKQILVLLDNGMSNEQMAQEMGISTHTCKVHLWRLYTRLGINSRTQAAKWWRDHQPQTITHAMRAAFDAACRMHDQLKADGGRVDTSEFDFHRNQVLQMMGATK
jgi:DNA-binding NarL/FixJ family response regulator